MITTTLVETKLQPPFSDDWLARPRLAELLKNNQQPTLIVAPPGYGKTTLAAWYAATQDYPCCWLTLDQFDNQPMTFWRYLISSLQTVDPQLGASAMNHLRHEINPQQNRLADDILQDLNRFTRHRLRPRRVLLVIDDIHHLSDKELITVLNRLLDYLPNWLQVVITSRTSFPGWAKRVSRNRGNLIDAEALAFSAEETASLCLHRGGSTDDQALVQGVYQRSDGWPAAIVLLLHHLKKLSKPERTQWLQTVESPSPQLLSDYLQEELWYALDSDDQALLLTMAIAAPWCPAELLSDIHDIDPLRSARESAWASQVTISQHRGESGFQLHPLFRQWITDHCTRYQPQLTGQQRQRVLDYWISKQDWQRALRSATEAQNWEVAAQLFAQQYEHWVRQGDLQAMNAALISLPQSIATQHPAMLLAQAQLCFIRGELSAMEQALNKANQRLQADIAASAALSAQQQNLAAAAELLQALANLYNRHRNSTVQTTPATDDTHPLADWWLYHACVSAFEAEDLERAIHFGEQAVNKAWQQNNLYCLLATLPWLAHARYQHGEVKAAESELNTHLQRLKALGYERTPAWVAALGASALLAMEQQNAEQVESCFNRIQDSGPDWVEPREWLYNHYHLKAQWLMLNGQHDAVESWLDQAEQFENQQLTDINADSVMPATHQFRLWAALQRGDSFALLQWAMTSDWQDQGSSIINYMHNFLWLAARLLSGQDEWQHWQALYDRSVSKGWMLRQYGLLMLRAGATAQTGEEPQPWADQAFDIAHRCGYELTVHSGRQRFAPLLAQWQKNRQCQWPAHNNIASNSAAPALSTADKINLSDRPPLKAARLTRRENEVFSALARGLSNQEIARELDIALTTVKRHVQNLFSKLNINSRTQAALLFNHYDS
ncbi:helix-turn-helix transcriptional regulator [Thalassolituus marinus]|uniref:AAA family ATPase n=1 Tax=Thalassolituus marinus TaxID=671053 RepID=A0ABS7ZMA5_9GAMM|nr:LuxR C-terminal-related transcriptional regulator [Thalassolituus marinus]MCA6062849.1 AAA family ATPase [Thalassolituus marinus]